MRHRFPGIRFVLLLAAMLAAAACADPPVPEVAATAAPPPDSVSPSAPPIGEASIPSRADLATTELNRVEAFLEPTRGVSTIEAELERMRPELVALRAELDAMDPDRVSSRELRNDRIPWELIAEQIAEWDQAILRRYDAVVRQREELRRMSQIWAATATEVRDEPLTPELARRVESQRVRIAEVEDMARNRRNQLGVVLEDLATARAMSTSALGQLDVLAGATLARVAERNVPPLWQSLDAGSPPPLASDARRAGAAWWRSLRGYVAARPSWPIGWAVLLMFFIVLTGRLGRRISELSDDADEFIVSDTARELFARPYSLAVGLSLLTLSLLAPLPGGSLRDIVTLVAAVTMIRLGKVVLAGAHHRALVAVGCLAMLERFSSITPDASLLDRLTLLSVSIVGACVIAWVLRRHQQHATKQLWPRIIATVGLVAAVFLATAAVANVAGWTEFARLLTEATLESLFSGSNWVVGVLVLRELLPVVLSDWAGLLLPSLRRNRRQVGRWTLRVASLVGVIRWSARTLIAFHLFDAVDGWLRSALFTPRIYGGLSVSLGSVLAGVSVILATWVLAALAGFLLREEVMPRMHLQRGASSSIQSIVNYSIWGIGIALAASAAGLTGTQLAVVIGALSVGIGFGLQTIVNNFVSGLILIFERPVKVGDTLQMPDYWGRVEHIGIRASVIRSFDGAEIIVPNGDLIAKEVINWTGTDDIRRVEVLVGVEYGTDPERVLAILLEAAEENERALSEPPPQAQMLAFGNSSLDFRLRCWAAIEHWIPVASDLHVAINRKLADAGITIPFPQRDLHIRSDDTKGTAD